MLHQEEDRTTQSPLKPVADLWFANNQMAVIRAGEKEFRVPQCILMSQSPVFREFLKRDTSSTNLAVGVELSEPPNYVEYFFRALYHSGYFEPPPRRCELEHALGILSLSTKYEVDYLKKRALSHLATGYAITLGGWRNQLNASTFQPITDFSIQYAHSNIPKSFSVLKILNQVGAIWLLPSAFYECCRYDIKDLIANPTWVDGTLDDGLKNAIIVAYTKQVQEARYVLKFLHRPPAEDCSQPLICMEVRRKHAEESFSSWDMNNPFGIWDDEDWELLEEMCAACLDAAKETHAGDCLDLWKRLPALYDLPRWEMLLELKDSAML